MPYIKDDLNNYYQTWRLGSVDPGRYRPNIYYQQTRMILTMIIIPGVLVLWIQGGIGQIYNTTGPG